MKKIFYIAVLFFVLFLISASSEAQCAVCTKTALQMGEKPATGLNRAILYLMLAPFTIVGFIGYRLWRGNKGVKE
ncbi:MAG TPA: hypothetical protein PK987_00680 [Ferruginibacter sp.]|nr:hypothetical protein [Ferruginibacter sp.]